MGKLLLVKKRGEKRDAMQWYANGNKNFYILFLSWHKKNQICGFTDLAQIKLKYRDTICQYNYDYKGP
jgi:hypothetical protein